MLLLHTAAVVISALCFTSCRGAIIITTGPDLPGRLEVQNMMLNSEQRSWCQAGNIKQVITHIDCESLSVENQVCAGSCFSYCLPLTDPQTAGDNDLNFCESCQPSESNWINITMECTSDDGSSYEISKNVQKIINCTCSSCPGSPKTSNGNDPEHDEGLRIPFQLFNALDNTADKLNINNGNHGLHNQRPGQMHNNDVLSQRPGPMLSNDVLNQIQDRTPSRPFVYNFKAPLSPAASLFASGPYTPVTSTTAESLFPSDVLESPSSSAAHSAMVTTEGNLLNIPADALLEAGDDEIKFSPMNSANPAMGLHYGFEGPSMLYDQRMHPSEQESHINMLEGNDINIDDVSVGSLGGLAGVMEGLTNILKGGGPTRYTELSMLELRRVLNLQPHQAVRLAGKPVYSAVPVLGTAHAE